MGLREDKFWEKLCSAALSSLFPAIFEFVGILLLDLFSDVDNNPLFLALVAILSAICMMLSYLIYYKILPKFKGLRELGKYEGRWLQIIPESSERPCSIIDFTYNKASLKYEMLGFNFTKNLDSGVEFKAFKFVERTFRDGFYFITNQTNEHKNGLGKIAFVKSNFDNLTRAIGYFFDSSSDNCSRKYDTILIKCDKHFYEHLGPQYRHINADEMTPIEIAEISKELVDKEIQKYQTNKNAQSNQRGKCDLCPYHNQDNNGRCI